LRRASWKRGRYCRHLSDRIENFRGRWISLLLFSQETGGGTGRTIGLALENHSTEIETGDGILVINDRRKEVAGNPRSCKISRGRLGRAWMMDGGRRGESARRSQECRRSSEGRWRRIKVNLGWKISRSRWRRWSWRRRMTGRRPLHCRRQ
jgi:hypothetical protein